MPSDNYENKILSEYSGLSNEEVQARLKIYGPNSVELDTFLSLRDQLIKILTDPMGLMLLALAMIYWILGDKSDSIIMLVAFVPVTAVDVLLEIRSTQALKALKRTLTKSIHVIRQNEIIEIQIEHLVPGDIIVFEEGQTLPVDGQILKSQNLVFNESSLTGESVPIEKNISDPFWGGTTVLSGNGVGLVEKTGKNSKYGTLAELVGKTEEGLSPLRKTINKLVKIIVLAASFVAIILFFLEYYRTQDFISSLIESLTLGMAAIPEEFPLVFTLYLSLGAWRLSQKGVLVKSLPSVEALGGVDVICTDKTGTLTEGIFQLEKFEILDNQLSQEMFSRICLMSCEVNPIDSLEKAIFKKFSEKQGLLKNWNLKFDYPFENYGKHMTHAWQNNLSGESLIAMKGATEGILDHCKTLSNEDKNKVLFLLEKYSSQGARVLSVGYSTLPATGKRSNDESEIKFAGLLIFSDPIREQVRSVIESCQKSGVQVKMMTGDHIMTAHYVADHIGLFHAHEQLFSGRTIEEMDDQKKNNAFLHGALFARLQPEQKYEMVKTLKKAGLVVAMMGDGINDAPALKAADIGISMGHNATDVARSAAQIVLIKNDFSGIFSAVLEGRQIYKNLKRSFSYLISFHFPVIFLTLIPSFFSWPILLMPIHIVILELIVHPISAYCFENIKDKNLEKNRIGFLLSRKEIFMSLLSGLSLSLMAISGYRLYLAESVETARAFAFMTVVLGNIFFVYFGISKKLNIRFFITASALFGFAALASFSSVVTSYLHFSQLSFAKLSLAFFMGFVASFYRLFTK